MLDCGGNYERMALEYGSCAEARHPDVDVLTCIDLQMDRRRDVDADSAIDTGDLCSGKPPHKESVSNYQ